MSILDRLSLFSWLDATALALVLASWAALGWLIERPSAGRPSVTELIAGYNREWMRQLVNREVRIFDSQIIGNLRQGTAFFASATMLAIGGGLALIGNTERLVGVATDLTLAREPAFVWEVKLLVVLAFVTNAFLKFVWAHRLFGYCSVLIASVPNDATDPAALPRAAKAAEINISAIKSFNRGLRAVYFALGTLPWLLGSLGLLAGCALTVLVIWRREFSSHSRRVLMQPGDGMAPTQS